jgi:hypothetical protein
MGFQAAFKGGAGGGDHGLYLGFSGLFGGLFARSGLKAMP